MRFRVVLSYVTAFVTSNFFEFAYGDPCHGVFEDEVLFGKRWTDKARTKRVIWAEHREPICNASENCLKWSPSVAVTQFEPILVQVGQNLEILFPENTPGVTEVLHVKEFRACNSSQGSSLVQPVHRIDALDIPGSIYLLELSVKCLTEGKRVKVSWIGQKCASTNISDQLCNGEGVCVLPKNKPSYQCLCCDGTMVDNGMCSKPSAKRPLIGPSQLDDPAIFENCTCSPSKKPECCADILFADSEPCNSQPCKNGGICRVTATDPRYICLCERDYSGLDCQIKAKRTCIPNPCMFGSRCFINDDTIECIPETLIGNLRPCIPNPCHNEAPCYFVRGIPRCFCGSTHVGTLCENVMTPESIFSASNHGGGVFVALATLICAILVVVMVILTFQCQLWSCYVLPTAQRRRSYTSWTYDQTPSPGFSRVGSSKVSTSEHSKLYFSESIPTMYTTVDDFPMTSVQSFQASAIHFESEKDLLVTKT